MASAHHLTNEDRARLLAEWQASGASATEFAPRAGVSAHTLYAWRRRARADAHGASAGRFAELVVRHAPASIPSATEPSALIEITVGEAVVRVGADSDDAHLRRVLDVVRTMA